MALLKLKPRQPDPFIVSPGDQEIAKFGHIKRLIDKLTERLGDNDYLIYSALLTQVGTDPPVAVVLNNTIGNIVWSREHMGVYDASLQGAFPDQNKVMLFGLNNNAGDPLLLTPHTYFGASWIDSDTIRISTTDLDSLVQFSDTLLLTTSFEIRIYK